MIWLPLTVLVWALIVIGLRQSGERDGGLVLRAFGVPLITQMCLIIWMQAVGWRYLTVLLPGAVLIGVGAFLLLISNLKSPRSKVQSPKLA